MAVLAGGTSVLVLLAAMAIEHRVYSDEEISAALALLAAYNGNAKRAARDLNIPRTTLRQWANLSPVRGKQVAGELVDSVRADIGRNLMTLSRDLLEKVGKGLPGVPVETAQDVRNLLVGLGITTTQAQLLTGGPTVRSEHIRISLVSPGALREGLTVIDVTASRPAPDDR